MKYRFIGIGGVSMSGLALYLQERGEDVTGSDIVESENTNILRKGGIDVDIGSFPEKVKEWDRVVYTSAVKEDDRELCAAKALGIPVVKRSELLGEIFNAYDYGVAVAGMHGKSTVTAMLSEIFEAARLEPTFFIGARRSDGKNYKRGRNVVIAEACEYRKSFLSLNPHIAVVLNMELEHPDCYTDTEEVYKAFNEFVKRRVKGGVVVAHESAARALFTRCITYGMGARCVFRAENIKSDKGRYTFDVLYHNRFVARVPLGIYGKHNVENALCAFAVSFITGINARTIAASLSAFSGIERRLEQGVSKKGQHLLFDYAHHPRELVATLTAAKEMTEGKIVAVFQPHTYSRTKKFVKEFALALSIASEVVLLPVYSAREKEIEGGTEKDICNELVRDGVKCTIAQNFEEATEMINKMENTALVTILGAGDVYKLKEML